MQRCASPDLSLGCLEREKKTCAMAAYSYPLPNRFRSELNNTNRPFLESNSKSNDSNVINLPSAIIIEKKKILKKTAKSDSLLSLPSRPLHQRSVDDTDNDLDIVAQNKLKSKVAKKAIKKLTKDFTGKLGSLPLSPLSKPNENNVNMLHSVPEFGGRSLARTRSFSEYSETSSMSSAASYTGDGLDTEDEGVQKRLKLTKSVSCHSNLSTGSFHGQPSHPWDFEPVLSDFDNLQIDNDIFDDELDHPCVYSSAEHIDNCIGSESYNQMLSEAVDDLTISHISCTTEEFHGFSTNYLQGSKKFGSQSKYFDQVSNEEKLTMTVFDDEDEIFGLLLQDDLQCSIEAK